MNRERIIELGMLAMACLCCSTRPAAAQPIPLTDIPPELLPWIGWVRDQHPSYACPIVEGETVCAWPGELSFNLDDRAGSFEQRVVADGEIEVTLPGSQEYWPVQVSVDNKLATVLERDERPSVRVRAGEHRIAGRFLWPRLPEVLPIPRTAALVSVRVNSQPLAFPKRDGDGKLWLKSSGAEETQGDKLELEVHRRIDDAVPLRITTRLVLRTGGQAREINLGNLLLDGTIPLELTADLPARLDQTGDLIVQVRAGIYRIEITARSTTSPASLQTSRKGDFWPDQEIWVWCADENLRQVSVTGAAAIDPARTTLDEDWRNLPAYVMRPGSRMVFTTQRRGEPDPPPNRLSLTRQMWLDLDGRGYTIRDAISGTVQKDWRLDLLSGELGRVAVGGVDQLITKSPGSGRPGVELRQADLALAAEWRAENSLENIPAVAWSEDLQSLSATLSLPPGWSILSANGVDSIDTWLSQWDLLGFFFVLLVALAVGRLVGVGWGALALITLALCFHEKDAPYLVWIALLIAVALLKVLPMGRLRWLVRLGWWGSVIALLVIGIPFAVQQIRTALFPQISEYDTADRFEPKPILRRTSALNKRFEAKQAVQLESDPLIESEIEQEAPASPREAAQQDVSAGIYPKEASAARREKGLERTSTQSLYEADSSRGDDAVGRQKAALKQDPTAVVQTGPGVPTWSFRSWQLSWSGPVAREHEIRLRLISPNLNRALSLLRVVLLAILAFCLIRPSRPRPRDKSPACDEKAESTAAAAIALSMLLFAPAFSRADFPDKELLDDLSNRLARAPACAPDCVSVSSLHLEIDRRNLKMTAEVHAGSTSSFKIPGPAQAWVPQQVRVDGNASAAVVLLSDGFLHARLTSGIHRVEVAGPLPPSDSLVLTLGDSPHRVSAKAEGWMVDGLREDGRAEESIQLSRQLDGAEREKLEKQILPPWLEVTREFEIGTTWKIHSTVRRISPTGSPIVARFPLLEGESVADSRLLVEDKHLVISLNRDDRQFTWSSTFEQRNQIPLVASGGKPWSEIWVLRCGPIWSCGFEGLAPARHEKAGVWEPTFYPWPDEKLSLRFVRPQPAGGQSTTIDSATLEVNPGVRILKARLDLAIRSSKGAVQSVTLPKGSRVQSLQIDGNSTPIRFEGEKLSFNLKPGVHEVALDWQHSSGIQIIQRVPKVDLGFAAANATVVLNLPKDRWLLWTDGPAWGPAILFWGYLVLLLFVAVVLPRLEKSPLKAWQWILLGLGLTQIPAPSLLVVVGWFFAIAYRNSVQFERPILFDLCQLLLLAWTVTALGLLYAAIHQGLLFEPDMQVLGAGSTEERLVWYVDRVQSRLPTPWVLSVSIWVWKTAMLFWSLWLASSLIKWLPWAWECMNNRGLWKPIWRSKPSENNSVRG
ncbi:MAG: hypothetical protein JXA30_06885 [Deltaproteobacteria bacterium]|nr:hypothetical protein [Deltaproteobacteria bacterium]